jgi:hypothetical protein
MVPLLPPPSSLLPPPSSLLPPLTLFGNHSRIANLKNLNRICIRVVISQVIEYCDLGQPHGTTINNCGSCKKQK